MKANTPSPCDIRLMPEFVKIDMNQRTAKFVLKSETTKGLAFKIKTTKPREYIVEPSFGKLPPFNEVTIDVGLTPESTITEESVGKEKIISNQTAGDSRFISLKDHRFKVEVYKFDWRQNDEELKAFLKRKDVESIEKKLEVCVLLNKKKEISERNEIIGYVVYGFILINFVRLLKVMFE